MVDYDSDEDEDEDEDDDEEDAGEDEDVVDEDDEGEEALEEGLLSPSDLKDIEGNAKANMNEDITLNTSIKGDNATKDANIVPVLSASLPSVTASTNQPITSNENITEMKTVGKEQVDSKEELARLSDKLPDTHESQQSSKEDCTYSIEKSNLEVLILMISTINIIEGEGNIFAIHKQFCNLEQKKEITSNWYSLSIKHINIFLFDYLHYCSLKMKTIYFTTVFHLN